MNWIYHLGLYLFKFLLIIGSPINLRAKKWINGRKGLFSEISAKLEENEKRVWFHAASLGEFEQGRPIIEALKARIPELKIVLTFFSPSGYEIRKNYDSADYVFYLPLDTRKNAQKFIELINPAFVVFIKYEFWYNFLQQLKKRNIPTYLISAIFRKEQVFFKPWGKWYRNILQCFKWFFVQNEDSKNLLEKFGFQNVSISGDTRFDRVLQIASSTIQIPIVEQFTKDKMTLIIGSSWKADEEVLFDYINNSKDEIRFILAPHEIHESNIHRIANSLKVKYMRFSQASQDNVSEAKVLIIDNIGMLSSIYKYGQLAYIGGGFGSGIHNILEAATFSLPVIFGPNYKKYREAVDLVKSGGAFEVKNQQDTTDILNKLVSGSTLYNKASQVCKQYVEKNSGACEVIMYYLSENQHI